MFPRPLGGETKKKFFNGFRCFNSGVKNSRIFSGIDSARALCQAALWQHKSRKSAGYCSDSVFRKIFIQAVLQ